MPNLPARMLSILGHPLLLLPSVALLLAVHQGADAERLWVAALALATAAALVMAYSWWQVRRRRWRHVDASGHGERSALNRVLLVVFLIAAALSWAFTAPRELALGLALAASLIASAMLSARCCTLSLHVAFATYAAVLLVDMSWLACTAGLAFASAVAWSRLALSRHAPRDLVAGAAAGAAAGLLFRQWSGVAG